MFKAKDTTFDKDSLQTPKYIFNWLDSIYNFDVDICADDRNHLCSSYYTKDGLALNTDMSIRYRCGFNNPPYSDIDPWIELAIREAKKGMTTVMLVPDFNGEARFSLVQQWATNIIHLSPRVGFIKPNGEKYNGNNRGSCVIEFSKKYLPSPPTHTFVNLKEIKKEFG